MNNRTLRSTSIFLLLCLIICAKTLYAQQPSTNEQLAQQYLSAKEYDKALVYYEKLFLGKTGNVNYYAPYLLCLTKLGQINKAEKTIKRLIKQYPQNLPYVIDLGSLYIGTGKKEKGEKQYESAIKALSANQQQILDLANDFIRMQEFDYAIETYKQGKKLLNGFYPFSAEIAEVYERKGDVPGMVREYLSLLDYGDDQLQAVQNGLQPSFEDEKDEIKNDIIKTELLKKIQSEPDKPIYTELLIWFFVQEKKFDKALIHAKALDKRNHEDGDRIMKLGLLCASNEDYETAIKCFQYVIEKGTSGYFYINARIELLNAQYKKITTQDNYTQTDLLDLENNFKVTLKELNNSPSSAIILKNLAHLEAFYLNRPSEAITLLNNAIKLPGVNQTVQAQCKLELGDILLMTGEIWDASLLYSQVEFDFKHDVLGNEAKFRNAKLTFYNGQFKWAQAQLDILKGSTEKLIANDAMALSLLISDNLKSSEDSTALSLYAHADLLSFKNQNEKVLLTLDSITKAYPNTSLADEILFKKYQIFLRQKKFAEAGEWLQKIIDNYSSDILGDDALFYLAQLNEKYLNNPEKAKQLYEEFLTKYPGSLFTVEARRRYRILRGDNVN